MARNAVFSVTQIVVTTVSLFWVYRRCALTVGLPALGVWSVTTGLVSLLTVADLGITEAMVREVARFRTQSDWMGMRRAIGTCSLYVGCAIAVAGLAAFPLVRLYLEHVLDPHAAVRIDLLIASSILILASNTISVGLMGAIEGFELYSSRLMVASGGSLALVVSSYLLIPRFGTLGIALIFMSQSLVNLLVATCILRALVRRTEPGGWEFSLKELRRMSRIGIPLRLASLVSLTYEPITRLLVVKFGGIGSAGTYEAAVRCGIQARALIAGCVQVVVPRFSALAVDRIDAFRGLLRFAYKITGLLVIGALPLILLATPLISYVLLGRLDGRFELYAEILSFGWLVNALAIPASYANLADGRMFWTWFGNVWAAIINPILGLLLGAAIGANGVVISTGCALVSTAIITVLARRLTAKDRIPRPGPGSIVIIAAAVILVCTRLAIGAHVSAMSTHLAASAALCALFALVWIVIAFKTVRNMLQEVGIG